MRLLNLLKRVNLVNSDLELARLEQVEELIDIEFEFFASLNVAKKLRTGNLDTLGGEFTIQGQSMSKPEKNIKAKLTSKAEEGRGRWHSQTRR